MNTHRRILIGLVAAAAMLLAAAPANAGRMLVTGHDTDVHCGSSGAVTGPHCHYIRVAVEWVRATAPDPTKKLLLLSCSTGVATALASAYDNTLVPAYDRVCPTDAAWSTTPLNTGTYSAIVVASAFSGIGASGSSGVNARKTDIEAFFNAGGGIFANTGITVPTYYDFLPLSVSAGSNTGPYTLTSAGQNIGLQDSTHGIGTYNDINCCATHNNFAEPAAGSPITVAERDANNTPMTLIAEGSISGGQIVAGAPPAPPTVVVAEPDTALTASPAAETSATSATFEFASTQSSATFECRLDQDAWAACTSPHVVSGLGNGAHTFSVRAAGTGVMDASPALAAWTVDTAAPAAPSLTGGPERETTTGVAELTWTGEAGGTFTCAVDGGAAAPCTSPLTLTRLGVGRHEVVVRQVDNAGNAGAALTWAWTVVEALQPQTPAPEARLTLETTLPGDTSGHAEARNVVFVHGGERVDVGCRLVGAPIAACHVSVYGQGSAARIAAGGLIGEGSIQVSGRRTRVSVPIRLSGAARRALSRAPRGLPVRLRITATAAGQPRKLRQNRLARLQAPRVAVVPSNGQFDFLDARLDHAQQRYIRHVAGLVAGARRVTCIGHTSNAHGRPGSEANMALGARRAAAVCRALMEAGFNGRIRVRSAGGTRPRAGNASVRGRALNRRVELVIQR